MATESTQQYGFQLEPELVVVANREADLRATHEGLASAEELHPLKLGKAAVGDELPVADEPGALAAAVLELEQAAVDARGVDLLV